jgi:excisionase family DNA binding protein
VADEQPTWLTVKQAAARAQVGPKTIYRAVHSRQAPLRAAVVGGRRDLRFLAAWVDAWLEQSATPVEVSRRG